MPTLELTCKPYDPAHWNYRRVDASLEDGRPTAIGLAWLPEVISLEPSGTPKVEPWLVPSACAVHELSKRHDASMRATVRSGAPRSTCRARHCFEVASVFFNLYDARGVDLLSATGWLQKCQEELDAHIETSEEKREVQNDAKRMREEIHALLDTTSEYVLENSLISGGVHDIVSRFKRSEVGNDWKRGAWSVLVLRAIAELSTAIIDASQSSFLDDEMSAVFSAQQLGDLFYLFGDKVRGDWYTRAAESLSQLGLSRDETVDGTNVVELVEEAIKSSKSLVDSIRYLSGEKNLVLNTFEKSFLRIRFIRYNLEQLPIEADAHLKQSNWKTTKAIVATLDTITLIEQIPEPFKNLKACQILNDNKGHISKKEEQICISKFKLTCLEHQISSFSKRDVDFMDALRTVLRTCADVDSVAHALDLHAFYEERGDACDKLVTRVLEHHAQAPNSACDAAMNSLRQTAELLKDHAPQWYIEDHLKELVWSYIRPAQIRKLMLDGRLVIEVKCKKIKLSKVLPEVLAMFENPRVEEVRFVVPDCLRLDANLEASRWHGVNLWIQTELLQVAGGVVLDLSGAKGTPVTYARRAADGVEYGESGKRGSDGFAGESGGNVSIFAEIDRPERLTVISRGGDGGSGQNGGNGRHGKDGFTHTFNSLTNFLGQQNNIQWWHDSIVSSIAAVPTERVHVFDRQKNFYHITTKEGGEIMYSYNWDTQYAYTAHIPWHNHCFFIHLGGPGMMGGRGGKPGSGGLGGYGGSVEFRSRRGLRIQDRVNGANGNDGSPGRGSQNGKSGYDIAFTPNETTASTWYGEEEGKPKSLKVQFTYAKPSGNWTWSPYKNQYALIVETIRRETYLRNEKEEVDIKLEKQAEANKKKNISTEAMLNTYQMYTDSIKVTDVHRDNFEAALKKETAELRALSAVTVKEKVRINIHRDKYMDEKTTVFHEDVVGHNVDKGEALEPLTAENFVADMVRNPTVKEKWFKLKYFVPSPEQFKRLFKATIEPSIHLEIKNILIDKYRSSSLQEVVKKGEKHFESFDQEQSSGPIEKYLFKDEGRVLVVDSKEQE